MRQSTRIILGILLGLPADFYCHLFLYRFLGSAEKDKSIRYVLSISTVIIVAFVVWKLTANLAAERWSRVKKGGVIGAVVGILIGVAGPLLLQPSANLGPLLGIFFTIPIGFIVGLVFGSFYRDTKYPTA